MREQRSGARSRRAVLRAVPAVAAGAFTGCVAGSASGGEEPVSILAAGSLHLALAEGLAGAVEVPVQVEAHGSATVARLVDGGERDPDLVAVADAALFDSVLRPRWYATFASNALVVAYDPDTRGGRRVADGGPQGWYRPIREGAATLGRTDPDHDPLGYRTLFMLELADRYYADAGELRETVPPGAEVFPERSLVSRLETGGIDTAVVYRNMAVQRGYDYVDLPAKIDLSEQRFADDWYRRAAYTLSDGVSVRGDVIRYGSTARREGRGVREVFQTLVTGEFLTEYGFVLPAAFPQYEGDVPSAVRA